MSKYRITHRVLGHVIYEGDNLSNADLRYANLSNANLSNADLSVFRTDLLNILRLVPDEVPALREKIIDGEINGSVYEGRCACLVGTIAAIRNCRYTDIPDITPNHRRPAEVWFSLIRPGQVPEIHAPTRLAVEWIDQFLALPTLPYTLVDIDRVTPLP
jgi:hypothetical protein